MRLAKRIAPLLVMLLLAACGGSPHAVYGYIRHVTVNLTGTQALRGTFEDSNSSLTSDACAASVRHSAGGLYPMLGTDGDSLVDGQAFKLIFSVPRAPQTFTRAVTVQVGNTYYDGSGTIVLRRDGAGSVTIPEAVEENGTGRLGGTVSWTCRTTVHRYG